MAPHVPWCPSPIGAPVCPCAPSVCPMVSIHVQWLRVPCCPCPLLSHPRLSLHTSCVHPLCPTSSVHIPRCPTSRSILVPVSVCHGVTVQGCVPPTVSIRVPVPCPHGIGATRRVRHAVPQCPPHVQPRAACAATSNPSSHTPSAHTWSFPISQPRSPGLPLPVSLSGPQSAGGPWGIWSEPWMRLEQHRVVQLRVVWLQGQRGCAHLLCTGAASCPLSPPIPMSQPVPLVLRTSLPSPSLSQAARVCGGTQRASGTALPHPTATSTQQTGTDLYCSVSGTAAILTSRWAPRRGR